jgi:uncharacterized protein YidB (DUF937 family)
MGILDLITGFLTQKNSGTTLEQSPLTQVLLSLLNNPNGMQQGHVLSESNGQATAEMSGLNTGINGALVLIDVFKNSGLGDQVDSWLSTEANLPIHGADIIKVLGDDRLNHIANALGVNPEAASQQLAQHIPNLIDQISPNGHLPQKS